MIFEDKRLHQVPKPWISMSKFKGFIFILMGLFLIFGFVMMFYAPSDSSSSKWLSLLLLVPGLLLLLAGFYAFMDRKDRWEIYLPFNDLLFELVSEKAPEMLEKNKYKYTENEKASIKGVIMKGGRPVAKSYRIFLWSNVYFDFEFALTMTSSDNGNTYRFNMAINHVTMDNLKAAKNFQVQLQDFLEEIEYKKFKEVRKV